MDRFSGSVFPVAKVDEWREFMSTIEDGERAQAHREFLRGLGIEREHVFLQQTPDGYVMVLIHEGVDQSEIAGKFGSFIQNPQTDHQRYIATYVIPEVHGVDMSAGPPPEMKKVATIDAGVTAGAH